MPYWLGLVYISKIILVMVKSIIRILTRVCLDLLSLVNSLHTLFKILIFRVCDKLMWTWLYLILTSYSGLRCGRWSPEVSPLRRPAVAQQDGLHPARGHGARRGHGGNGGRDHLRQEGGSCRLTMMMISLIKKNDARLDFWTKKVIW